MSEQLWGPLGAGAGGCTNILLPVAGAGAGAGGSVGQYSDTHDQDSTQCTIHTLPLPPPDPHGVLSMSIYY